MKKAVLAFLTICLFLSLTPARPLQQAPTRAAVCALMERALADSRRIAPGVKRREVEKHFQYDGGVQFPDHSRYTYRTCMYIKLEVEFEAAPERGPSLNSPDDTVKAVSKLFIDYPIKD